MRNAIRIIVFFTALLFLSDVAIAQQDAVMRGSGEHKKVWKKWRSRKETYNPYVDAPARKKPSARMAKGDRKEIKRQQRMAKKQMRRSKKKVKKY